MGAGRGVRLFPIGENTMRGTATTYRSDMTAHYSNDTTEVIEAIFTIGDRGYRLALPILLELLQTTNNHAIRDAIAVTLRELRDERALQPLVSLIKDPKTAGHRGTLLYALEVFDCAPILPLLVDLVITGNFEVSHQAFLLIESIESEIDDETWTTCLRQVKDALEQAEDEKNHLLSELLDLFEASS